MDKTATPEVNEACVYGSMLRVPPEESVERNILLAKRYRLTMYNPVYDAIALTWSRGR